MKRREETYPTARIERQLQILQLTEQDHGWKPCIATRRAPADALLHIEEYLGKAFRYNSASDDSTCIAESSFASGSLKLGDFSGHDSVGQCAGEVFRLSLQVAGKALKSLGDYATLQAAKDAALTINVPLEVFEILEEGVEAAFEAQEHDDQLQLQDEDRAADAELLAELTQAALHVVESWEGGDLAGSVRKLDGVLIRHGLSDLTDEIQLGPSMPVYG